MDYKREKALEAIGMVALREGISADEVYQEIESAIESDLSNPNPEAQKAWQLVSRPGETPTPEDIILYAIEVLSDRANDLTPDNMPCGRGCDMTDDTGAEKEGAL
jgi:hypothetical protein